MPHRRLQGRARVYRRLHLPVDAVDRPQPSAIKFWEVATCQEFLTLTDHLGAVKGLAFNPEGNILASGSFDKTVRIWESGDRAAIGV